MNLKNKAFAFIAGVIFLWPGQSFAASDDTATLAGLQSQLSALVAYVADLLDTYTPLEIKDEKNIIADAATWIVAAQDDTGHFGYEYLPYEDSYTLDDNMVRQAGTFSVLAEIYKKSTDKDGAMAAGIERSIGYFDRHSLTVNEEGYQFSCVRRTATAERCDLGSTALALLGILNYVAAEPEQVTEYEALIDDYKAFIMASRRPDAGFSNRYLSSSGFSDEESPFYNGEAMLALVRHYQYKADEATKDTLEEVFAYLAPKEYESPLYLWIMAALKDMQQLWPNEAYVAYAHAFTKERVSQARLRRGTDHNYCAPLEGLTSAYSVLDGEVDDTFLNSLYAEIEFWLAKSAQLQLHKERPLRLAGASDSLEFVSMLNKDRAHGGFLTGETELTQRIDFTQHCASAYLQKLVDIDGEVL